ncbi:hypothetical protein [Geothrix oryzisoli]|uniref:hypothetical protein n=1 Tax=Geothrix oryzisoli TaxID=2922721 RepID=UPI001FACBEAB|nr:hypothetical protein [Geothrix oryzisoli]
MQTDDPKAFPRVLVLSGLPFSQDNATGITLSNIFSDWPSENMALAFISGELEPNFGSKAMKLGEWRWFLPGYLARGVLPDRFLRLSREVPGGAPAVEVGGGTKALAWAHRFVRTGNEFVPVLRLGPLKQFIEAFNPDVIYSMLGSMKLIRFVNNIADRYNLPVVPHFMDDWPTFFYSDGFLCGLPRRALAHSLESLFKHVHSGLCIGEDMADEYQQRYRRPFLPLMNSIPNERFASPPVFHSSETVIFSYIGGLHLNRWQSLLEIASVMGEGTELRIFAPEKDLAQFSDLFAGFPFIKLGSLRSSEVDEEMRRADVLLHVESFDPDAASYTRLSVSTKISQYMCVGKPILAYGPGSLSSIKVIGRAGAGAIVGRRDLGPLRTEIRNLARDGILRKDLGSHGFEYARGRFSQSAATKTLRMALSKAAALGPRGGVID